jgi:hypothetical protein
VLAEHALGLEREVVLVVLGRQREARPDAGEQTAGRLVVREHLVVRERQMVRDGGGDRPVQERDIELRSQIGPDPAPPVPYEAESAMSAMTPPFVSNRRFSHAAGGTRKRQAVGLRTPAASAGGAAAGIP